MAAQKKKQASNVGLYQVLRDVLIASINKGQFPVAMVSLIFIVAILKMRTEDVAQFMFKFLDLLERGEILGDVMAFIALIGWFIHARYQRRTFNAEMERLSSERTQLQAEALGDRVKSSEVR